MKNVVRQTVFLFALILLCAAGTAYPAGIDMKEGDWEISSETSMKMEGMSMPSMANKSTYCLTREDPVPKSEKDKDCRIVKQKVVGNTVSWRMECKKGEGEGEISYRGTTYDGFIKMKMVDEGQTMTMNVKLAGKYLGPCPKGQKSGATGETAKQMAAGQQAAAQAQQLQAEQEALRKKCEEFVKRTAVPADAPGMCEQDGFTRSKECEEKVGKLNLEYGQYEITVEEARTTRDARRIAYAVANSNLVKTAFFGGDPNWGRIISAAGSVGIDLPVDDVSLFFEDVPLFAGGRGVRGCEKELAGLMKQAEIRVRIGLGMGRRCWTVCASDLSFEYVKINAEYHT